jgi:hypothetical protein
MKRNAQKPSQQEQRRRVLQTQMAVRPAEAERILQIGHTKLYQLLGDRRLDSVLAGGRTRLITMASIRRLLGLAEDAA